MTVQHYLIGYDKADGSLQLEIVVPAARMAAVKMLLPLYDDDPDAVDPYELSPPDARRIADLAGREVNERAFDFFLQAFDDPAPTEAARSAQIAPAH